MRVENHMIVTGKITALPLSKSPNVRRSNANDVYLPVMGITLERHVGRYTRTPAVC